MGCEIKNKHNIKPLIFWEGIPVCGLLMKQLAREFGDDIKIVVTKAAVPFQDIENMLDHKIIWLDNPNDIWKRKNEFKDRNFIIHTGWAHSGWITFDRYIKKHNPQARVVVAVDNRFRNDIRQWVGAIYFRILLRGVFDAAFVTGKSAYRLMRFFGMKDNQIYIGNYGAYEEIYKVIRPITERNKEFLFIGQLVERKGVDVLLEAFAIYRSQGGTWQLRMLGDGPLKKRCQGDGIICEGFVQPKDAAIKMNNAQVLILPSRHDNWGTVVCEAAACGMHIIATKTTGASEDIIKHGVNGLVIDTLTVDSLVQALFYYEKTNDIDMQQGSDHSVLIAGKFNSGNYRNVVCTMMNNLLKL